jgi:hypothetical protein
MKPSTFLSARIAIVTNPRITNSRTTARTKKIVKFIRPGLDSR